MEKTHVTKITREQLDGLMRSMPETIFRDICEQIQEDLLTFLDGMDESILNGVCQIVVDNFKKVKEEN